MRGRLALVAFLLGAFSIVAQTLLARELLVPFHGSELSPGLVLGSWLLLAGLGSWAGSPAARSPPSPLQAASTVTPRPPPS